MMLFGPQVSSTILYLYLTKVLFVFRYITCDDDSEQVETGMTNNREMGPKRRQMSFGPQVCFHLIFYI